MNEKATPRILVVEDDEVIAALTTGMLGDSGEIAWAASAEHALELLAESDFDLLVVDIGLPGISGLDLIRKVKDRDPLLATLILTGEASFDNAVEAIRAGADDFMQKPVDGAELVAKVGELTAVSARRRAKSRESVLAIGAHPDDIEIGVGGILIRHVARGDRVTLLTMTGGEQGGDTAERARESERAAGLIGAKLFHRELADTSVSDGGLTISTIKEVIDEVNPTTVYTHSSRDVHQDHRNVHSATLVAARGVPRIYCYQAPSTTVEFKPTKFMAIDDYIDDKLEAIAAYDSQVSTRAYLEPDLLRSTARYWSRFSGSTYVEPLEVIRESDIGLRPTSKVGSEAGEVTDNG
ncbi:MAG: response regulator [Solirubrobacterales bacterium]|nr:response regulator [Solirubrobacterales bacterium]MCB8915800.1 response regulator [Thermoleophilales bacterium]